MEASEPRRRSDGFVAEAPVLERLSARLLAMPRPPGRALLIGVDGCGGSGKSSLVRALATAVPEVSIVEVDDFYIAAAKDELPNETASHFDWRRLERDVLAPLARGAGASYQRFDWVLMVPGRWCSVENRGIVFVEGVSALRRELRGYYDFRIWVECDAARRLARGLERDGQAARHRWVSEWMPAEAAYMRDHDPAGCADFVCDTGKTGAKGENG